ncbi:YdcF family protein [Nocardia sp. XZ_19_369]|uniref:YdcF family protein n=1 Tax=Nocardia sp. XZ_19_369 TaxID=2769487 RepID=UPI00188E39FE|nr:YdcF family protein [Nocardia sp. XZ_19_369]
MFANPFRGPSCPARRTVRTLFGAVAVAAALVHYPAALAEGTGSTDRALPDVLRALVPPEPEPLPALHGPATAIVVLGYGLLPDGSMRPELIDRLHAGFVQALLAPASPIIVTGGNPHNGITEARAMADWFVEHGIAPERIHLEPEAASTVQNAEHSARIMRAIGARDAVVVTSADHIDRAVGTFTDAGVEVVGTVTPDQIPPLAWQFGPGS